MLSGNKKKIFFQILAVHKDFCAYMEAILLLNQIKCEEGISVTTLHVQRKVMINRGYHTVVRRYEFYVRVAWTISHKWAQRTSEILFLPREHEVHIFELMCNVLLII